MRAAVVELLSSGDDVVGVVVALQTRLGMRRGRRSGGAAGVELVVIAAADAVGG